MRFQGRAGFVLDEAAMGDRREAGDQPGTVPITEWVRPAWRPGAFRAHKVDRMMDIDIKAMRLAANPPPVQAICSKTM